MNGAGHRLAGAATGAAWAVTTVPYSLSVVAMSAAVASATSHGWMSPDADQCRPFVWLQKITPNGGRWGDPFGHRRATHWLGWPILAWYATSGWAGWDITTARLLILGWASHLLADLFWGTVPFAPWGGWHFGFSLDTGGFTERFLTWGPLPLLLGWLLLGAPGLDYVTKG